MERELPEVKSLSECYQTSKEQRFDRLKQTFEQIFHKLPAYFARAPGRVNLIGEHVDYSGFSVLPMAIEDDVVIAVSRTPVENNENKGSAKLHNTLEKFSSKEISFANILDHSFEEHSWTNYFVVAAKGLIDEFGDVGKQEIFNYNYDLLIDGMVPQGSGLSSSSALVCSFIVALIGKTPLSKNLGVLAHRAALCEKYVGIESGGMDQAISFGAQKGVAKLISFQPLASKDVILPKGAAFILCDSKVSHDLQKTASHDGYNVRVVECRLAAVVLGKQANLPNPQEIRTLRQFKESANLTFQECVAKSRKLVRAKGFTTKDISELAGISEEEVISQLLGSVKPTDSAGNPRTFKLGQRALHVFEESMRVEQFAQICSSENEEESTLEKLGSLMYDSHTSCAALFECSCLELDKLVTLCRKNGALGARLTGAGWGGWVITLVKANEAPKFVSNLREAMQYTEKKIFVTCASAGAAMIELP